MNFNENLKTVDVRMQSQMNLFSGEICKLFVTIFDYYFEVFEVSQHLIIFFYRNGLTHFKYCEVNN